MKYTFLMPAYKRKYLREAISSILSQTYDDFILIVSDDCSPEDLKSVVDMFEDRRIIYRRNERNIGGKNLVAHWNLLLEQAESEFVILAPDDDFYAPKFLEEIDKLSIKYPQIDVLKSRSQDVDYKGIPYKLDQQYPELMSQVEVLVAQTSGNYISGIGNYVFRTEALKRIGGFVDYPLAWWSDVMTHIVLSRRGIAVTKDILFSFRHFSGNISSRRSSAVERKAKTNATMMFCKDIVSITNSPDFCREKDRCLLDQYKAYLREIKRKSIYSSASVSTLSENISMMKRNPDVFSGSKNRFRLFRYWLLKDWMVDLILKCRKR